MRQDIEGSSRSADRRRNGLDRFKGLGVKEGPAIARPEPFWVNRHAMPGASGSVHHFSVALEIKYAEPHTRTQPVRLTAVRVA